MHLNQISAQAVDAAMKVHSALGPGLLESAYKVCLAHELRLRGFDVQTEVPVAICYEGVTLDVGYRIDMLVNSALILELKAIGKVLPVHEAQLLTHLKWSGNRLGLLLNFHEQHLKDGIIRKVNNL